MNIDLQRVGEVVQLVLKGDGAEISVIFKSKDFNFVMAGDVLHVSASGKVAKSNFFAVDVENPPKSK